MGNFPREDGKSSSMNNLPPTIFLGRSSGGQFCFGRRKRGAPSVTGSKKSGTFIAHLVYYQELLQPYGFCHAKYPFSPDKKTTSSYVSRTYWQICGYQETFLWLSRKKERNAIGFPYFTQQLCGYQETFSFLFFSFGLSRTSSTYPSGKYGEITQDVSI